jgi:hypothetical protein
MQGLMNAVFFRDEFVQQHHPCEGQKFVILHLCSHRDLDDWVRFDNYLLLETASKGTYRRVGRFTTSRTGRKEKGERDIFVDGGWSARVKSW